ncbi:hypothetical protein SKAU_G00387630 [Synaphobranchus kaupii]|uniref:Uncharacterized protein n=1 Tax=Synaphobranchus kaupii TaxID=118154 RepID=A0A9Q1EAZ0_SYNKA|nr:hypothetical protein SKAU_G00387630 [Synaphobranchus kaupii]
METPSRLPDSAEGWPAAGEYFLSEGELDFGPKPEGPSKPKKENDDWETGGVSLPGGFSSPLAGDSLRMDLPTLGLLKSTWPSDSSKHKSQPQAPVRQSGASSTGQTSVNLAAYLRKEPKIPMYQQGEDIENYLLRFERRARTWQWPGEDWACRLVPLLTGKALEAYTVMDEESSSEYQDLRMALLLKFNISPEIGQE